METVTARTRKKPLHMPPLHCQQPGCGEEYEPIGDYRETYDAAELGGWRYRIFGEIESAYQIPPLALGEWLCPGHKDVLPWWPGRTRPALLPARVPGATTRTAEVTGVVPSSWAAAALPAAEPPLEPLPEPSQDAVDSLCACGQFGSQRCVLHHDVHGVAGTFAEDVSRPGHGAQRDAATPPGVHETARPGHPAVPGSETDTGGRAEPERGPGHGHPDHGPEFVALEQWVAEQDSEATGE